MINNSNIIIGSLPFSGKWIVGNTPVKKSLPHGTN